MAESDTAPRWECVTCGTVYDPATDVPPGDDTPATTAGECWRVAWCPGCGVERTDYEVTTDGPQHLDICPNCGDSAAPTEIRSVGDDTPTPTVGRLVVESGDIMWVDANGDELADVSVMPVPDAPFEATIIDAEAALAALVRRAGAAPDFTALRQAVIDAAGSWADADINGPDYAAILANLYHAVVRYRAALVREDTP